MRYRAVRVGVQDNSGLAYWRLERKERWFWERFGACRGTAEQAEEELRKAAEKWHQLPYVPWLVYYP